MEADLHMAEVIDGTGNGPKANATFSIHVVLRYL